MSMIKDLQTLTTIPEKTLTEFFKKAVYCACNEIQEELLQEETPDILKVDIIFGELYIKETDEGIKYKFVPKDYFKKNIEETIKKESNPLKQVVNKTLIKKFLDTYKNLC